MSKEQKAAPSGQAPERQWPAERQWPSERSGAWRRELIPSLGPPPDIAGIRKKYLEIPYASLSPAQRLDLYLPDEGDGPFPVILSIHAGGFAVGDKTDGQLTAVLRALGRGYAVASMNHRYATEAPFPAQIKDVKAALRFLRASAGLYNLNPDRVAVWGASSGAMLAALAGVSAGVADLEGPELGNPTYSSAVQAVVDWFGPIDFLTLAAQAVAIGGPPIHTGEKSMTSVYLGHPLSQATDLAQKASPASYIGADTPPFLIQHGTDDLMVPVQQSQIFAAQLAAKIGGDKAILRLFEGAAHGGPAFAAAANIDSILDFLDQALA
ncbi:MAG: alpha/beta hydrolase [Peptococcaceae bacterium]|jgi:acetyl esterase/lipase|nr:alpha/beta hydrolase [Peptococcaceae bacterium]